MYRDFIWEYLLLTIFHVNVRITTGIYPNFLDFMISWETVKTNILGNEFTLLLRLQDFTAHIAILH